MIAQRAEMDLIDVVVRRKCAESLPKTGVSNESVATDRRQVAGDELFATACPDGAARGGIIARCTFALQVTYRSRETTI